MIITPMTQAHVAAVAALEAASFSTPWSEKSIGEELQNPWALWYVALEGERLLGYIGVQYGLDGGDIMTIATDPGCRGRGLGQKLVETVLDIFAEKDLAYLTLEVRPSNAPPWGSMKNWASGRWADGKNITGSPPRTPCS